MKERIVLLHTPGFAFSLLHRDRAQTFFPLSFFPQLQLGKDPHAALSVLCIPITLDAWFDSLTTALVPVP